MTHLLRVSIGKSVTLQLQLNEGLPAVEADATQLRQVVMNLVVNASDAIGDRAGVISVTSSAVTATRELLTDSYLAPDLPPGRYVALEVRDSGTGMDSDTMARIFDPFFTTKFTGRGLGLAAVLGIVRGHKGAITVESEPGKGTAFQLLIPATGGTPVEPAEKNDPAPWKGSGLVLVVDDEPSVRAVTIRALRLFGFETLEASDGFEGVESFREHADEIRCVLLDMTMPRMNGEETFIAMKEIRPDARILLMSGYAEQEVADRFKDRGLSGFIQKPYELGALRDALQGALDGDATT
jgi:CheY-like chemotaxis protein